MCGVISALLLVALILTSSLSLSAGQVADRDFGRFDTQLMIQGVGLDDRPQITELGVSLRTTDSALVLTTTAVSPSGLGPDRFVYREASWDQEPFPGITLESGRWPKSTTEVVVDPDTAQQFHTGSQMGLGSNTSVTVVGVARDIYMDATTLYFHPQTYAEMPVALATGLRLDAISLSVLTTSRSQPRVSTAVRAFAHPVQENGRDSAEAENSWVVESPFAVVVPLLTLPFLSSLSAAGLARRQARRFVMRASGVGMSARTGGLVARTAFLGWALLGTGVGIALGVLISVPVRRALSGLTGQAPGPVPDLLPVVATILTGVLAGSLLGIGRLASPGSVRRKHPTAPWARAARRWSALVVGCGAVFAFHRVTDVASAMIFGGVLLAALLLIVPDAVTGLARRLPATRPVLRHASRLILERRGTAASAAMLTVLVVLPTTTALMLTATGSAARNDALADVSAGQVGVDVSNLGKKEREAIVGVTRSLVQAEGGSIVSVSMRKGWYQVPSGNALVLSVKTPAEAGVVFGNPLTKEQEEELLDGGMLVWQPGHELWIDDELADPPPDQVVYQPADEWRKQAGAVLLDASADRMGLASAPERVVATGLDADDADTLQTRIADLGADARRVATHHAPRSIAPPLAITSSLITLVLLALLTSAAAAQSQAQSMRRYMERLLAIGAPRNYASRVLVTVQLVTTAVATGTGATVSAVAACALTMRNVSIELNPPWVLLAGEFVAFMTAALMSALVLSRSLKASASRHD